MCLQVWNELIRGLDGLMTVPSATDDESLPGSHTHDSSGWHAAATVAASRDHASRQRTEPASPGQDDSENLASAAFLRRLGFSASGISSPAVW